MESIIITIDGASSTGKSSLAKAIAKHYGFTHIDSGAMYRALTFYAQDKKLLNDRLFDVKTLISRLPTIDIDFSKNDEITLNGKTIEDEIRSMEVSNKVSIVAKARPLIIDTAISRKKASVKRGDIPNMVVKAASITGLRRLKLAISSVKRLASPSDNLLSISSTRIIQFLINIPARLKIPRKDGNVNGRFVINNPVATPHRTIGTVSQITMGCFSDPNIKMVTKNIRQNARGIRSPNDSYAILLLSNSPPHSRVYPKGNSILSISFLMFLKYSFTLCPLGWFAWTVSVRIPSLL